VIEINIEETKKTGTFEKFLTDSGFIKKEDNELYVSKEIVGFESIEVGI